MDAGRLTHAPRCVHKPVAPGAGLAERLIEETCVKRGIEPNQRKLHADRGSPMISKTVAQLY
jgi:hypothetical protein